MVATLLGLLIAVPAGLLTVASPAFADGDRCCQVSIDDMPAQFDTGGDATPFTVHVVNQTQQTLRYLDVSFVLQANGLVGDLVHLQRQRVLGGPHGVGTFTQHGVHSGVVTANDQIDFGMLALPPAGAINIEYQLSFNKKMPSGGLAVSILVQPRRSDGGISSAGPYQSTIVAPGQPIQTQPDPATTPTPTAATSDTAAAADETGVDAEPTEQSSLHGSGSSGGGGSLMWLAYTIGALLLLGGVGVIGMLVWRRGPHAAETAWDEPKQHGQPAYPTTYQHGGNLPARATTYGTPRQAGGHAAQTRVAPSAYRVPGPHVAPTSQLPVPQDPYADADQTWIDPAAGR